MAKKVTFYGILSALCLVLGYVETLLPLDFIAPGIKLGLANTALLFLILKNDIKGAFAVNIVRILLSALLFSAPSTLIYSFTAGIISLSVMTLLSKISKISVIGFSVIGAVVHNITQLAVAFFMIGAGVLYYLPFLLVCAVVCGVLTAFIADILFKKLNSYIKNI